MTSKYISVRESRVYLHQVFIIGVCVLLNFKTTLGEKISPLACFNRAAEDQSAPNAETRVLNDALQNLHNDALLELEEGEHCIFNYTLIRDLHNLTIRGEGGNATFIRCTHGNGLAFFNISKLTIDSVTVSNCGLNNETFNDFAHVVRQTIEFFFRISHEPDNYIAVACANCANFTLINAKITNTSGLGFLGINLLGHSAIENTHFTSNIPDGCSHSTNAGDAVGILQTEKTGGGAIIVYHDYIERREHHGHCNLHIDQANFYNNSYCGIQGVYQLHLYSHSSDDHSDKHFMLGGGGGLSIILTQIHYHVKAIVKNSLFMKNRAGYGGGANVEIFTAVFDSHIVFKGCNFTENGLDTLDHIINTSIDYVTVGSGIGFISDILQPSFNRSVDIDPDFDLVPCTVNITDSNFIKNLAYSGGALFIISLYAPLLGGTLQERLHIESCLFERNVGVVGGAVYAHEWKQSPFQQGLDIVFHSVTFDSNVVYDLDVVSAATQNKYSAVIEILSLNVTFSGESVISNNEGTGLSTSSSVIIFKDSMTFLNNRGSYGGALRLEAEAFLLVSDNTDVVFRNNEGTIFGGAVYVSYTAVSPSLSQVDCSFYFGHLNLQCFSTIHSDCPDITKYNTTITFETNAAPLGGMVYGTTLETCPWAKLLIETYATNTSHLSLFEIFDKAEEFNFKSPFVFDTPPNSAAEVSTNTGKIIVNASEIIVAPGQTLEIGIQTLDKFNRSVPTILTTLPSFTAHSQNVSTLLSGSNYHLLQQSHDPSNYTVAANITFFGDENVNKTNLSLFSLLSLTQAQFTVTITNCSEGFTYVESNHACECSDIFVNTRIDCNDDFTLVIPTDLWVGHGPKGDIVISHCHFDFCLNGKRTIHPPDYNQQCQTKYNRSGITCGQCNEGYSLMFGSNRCNKCSNTSLTLIILFALLGIILVSTISFLQITVSEGYLNGMLFYANILNIYLPLLTNSNSNVAYIFIFVSFLNLNLGFETCFYNGMNALARTSLNLVFPFYIFSLMFIIVGISKRSATFSTWFTRNGFSAAKVFVTLIVMTYSSLLETCIEILGFDRIGNDFMWRMDNNQKYFGGKHIILGILAIFLLFFLLALPFLLFLEGKLFKYRVLSRYKPLYDAVWAPFRSKFRFWVGLRLLLRGFPFIFIYFLNHPVNILLLAMFLVALLWIQGMLKPFRGFARNALDTFFLSNLLILVLGALYFYIYWAQFEIKDTSMEYSSQHAQPHKKEFYSIVMGMAYIAFLLVIFWHLTLRFPHIMRLLNTVNRRLKVAYSNKSDKKLRTFTVVRRKSTKSQYGAIANEDESTTSDQEQSSDEVDKYDSDKVVHERKAVVTYSQWREPLLSSGSLEIETIDRDKDDKA